MPESKSATSAMFRVTIQAPVQAVWDEITKTDEPIPAFFNSQMHIGRLAAGSRLAMRTADGKYTGVVGEVTECDPPRRFAHTFKFTNYDDPACKVIYTLEEVDGGTQFTLEIEDLPVGTKSAKQMIQGGTLIVNTLKRVMETGKPSFGVRMLYAMFKLMQPLSPKRCRSENWPIDNGAT